MTDRIMDDEMKDERESLKKAFREAEANRSEFLTRKQTPITSTEAYALLGYITALETDLNEVHASSTAKGTPRGPKDYNQSDLNSALNKIVIIAAKGDNALDRQ